MPRNPRSDEKRRHNLWEIVRYLWLKYVGISEEYELLREKWVFLQDIHPPAISLGKGSEVFRALDKSISRTSKIFKMFGFEKGSRDDYNKFKEHDLKFCDMIRTELFGLVSYVGLLKLAYLHRTISDEVVHSTGFAYGPEKTIGSEIVYVAADNVVKSYSECIKMKRRQPGNKPIFVWDNFVTFVPPIQTPGPFGALCAASPLGLFHISLSEEQKSQIAPLLMIAHEVAHLSSMDPDKVSGARDEFESLFHYVLFHTKNVLREFIDLGRLQQWYDCPNCVWNGLNWGDNMKLASEIIQEVFSDFVAFKIGGPTTIELLLDEFFATDEVNLRTSCISSYMRERNELTRANYIDFRIDDFVRRKGTALRRIAHIPSSHPIIKICPNCQIMTGQIIGRCLKNFEDRYPQIIQSFIKTGKEFSISNTEENTIISSLLEGIPQTSAEPRKILHCYFEAFKRTKRPGHKPRYPVALYSLAYNET